MATALRRKNTAQCVCNDPATRPLPDCVSITLLGTSTAPSKRPLVCESCYTWVRRHFRGHHKKCEARGITQRCQRYLQQFLKAGFELHRILPRSPVLAAAPATTTHAAPASEPLEPAAEVPVAKSPPYGPTEGSIGDHPMMAINSSSTEGPRILGDHPLRPIKSTESLTVYAHHDGNIFSGSALGAIPETSRPTRQRKPSKRLRDSDSSCYSECESREAFVPRKRMRVTTPVQRTVVLVRGGKYVKNPVPAGYELSTLCVACGKCIGVKLQSLLGDGSVWQQEGFVQLDNAQNGWLYLPPPPPASAGDSLTVTFQARHVQSHFEMLFEPVATSTAAQFVAISRDELDTMRDTISNQAKMLQSMSQRLAHMEQQLRAAPNAESRMPASSAFNMLVDTAQAVLVP